jgi:hypothetical protein
VTPFCLAATMTSLRGRSGDIIISHLVSKRTIHARVEDWMFSSADFLIAINRK